MGGTEHCMGGTAGTRGHPTHVPCVGRGTGVPQPLPTAELGAQSCPGPPVPARWPQRPGWVLPWADPARRILAPTLPFQRLNLPLRAMLCQVEKSQNKAAQSTENASTLRGNRLSWGTRSDRDTFVCPQGGICSHQPHPSQRSQSHPVTAQSWSPQRAGGTKLQPREAPEVVWGEWRVRIRSEGSASAWK